MALVQEQQETVEPGSLPHHPWSFLVINTHYSGLSTLWTFIQQHKPPYEIRRIET